MRKYSLSFGALIVLFSGVVVFNNCKKEPPVSYGTQVYCWRSLSSTILNNFGETPTTTSANTVNKDCYGFTIEFEKSYSCANKNDYPQYYTPSFSLYDSFSIITLFDFDSLHKKGTDVSSYFSANKFGAQTYATPVIISDWRKSLTQKTENKLLTTYFFLMQPPTLSDSVQFQVNLTQWNAANKILTVKTRKILLN